MIDPALAASAAATGLDLLRGVTAPEEPKPNDLVDKNDFLLLLITQLQNQDPLNPLDSADFSAQLAQFSALEQLTQINEGVGRLGGGSGGGDGLDMLGFLGTEVRAVSSELLVEGGVARALELETPSAGTVTVQVVDATGRQVADLDLGTLPAGRHVLDPASVAGAPPLADGTYTVLVTFDDGTTDVPIQPTLTGRVTGVDFVGDTPVLLLGETRIALEDVFQIREPGSATP